MWPLLFYCSAPSPQICFSLTLSRLGKSPPPAQSPKPKPGWQPYLFPHCPTSHPPKLRNISDSLPSSSSFSWVRPLLSVAQAPTVPCSPACFLQHFHTRGSLASNLPPGLPVTLKCCPCSQGPTGLGPCSPLEPPHPTPSPPRPQPRLWGGPPSRSSGWARHTLPLHAAVRSSEARFPAPLLSHVTF